MSSIIVYKLSLSLGILQDCTNICLKMYYIAQTLCHVISHPDGTTIEQPCATLSLPSFLHAPKNEVCTFEQTANQGVKVYLKCRHLIPQQSLLHRIVDHSSVKTK